MQVEKLQNLVEKLKERKNLTKKALESLIVLIKELEDSLSEDISTDVTGSKIKLKIDRKAEHKNFNDQYTWQLSDDKFSLFIKSGKIKIYKLYNDSNYTDDGYGFSSEKTNRYFFIEHVNLQDLNNKEYDVVRIDFKMLINALEELMLKAVEKSTYIDKDSSEFIEFCKEWKNR